MKRFFNQLFQINLIRAFNQQEGVTRKEDKLPCRFPREVLQDRENDPAPRSEGDAEGALPMKGLGGETLYVISLKW